MARRTRLSPEERARRAGKRDARARRRAGRTTAAAERFATAMRAYNDALRAAAECDDSRRVVCLRCGLVQIYRVAGDEYADVRPCASMGCDGLEAISIERYREEMTEPLVFIYG